MTVRAMSKVKNTIAALGVILKEIYLYIALTLLLYIHFDTILFFVIYVLPPPIKLFKISISYANNNN